MFKLLVDTCVWIDLAVDPKQDALLTALEALILQRKIELILPRTVVEEFRHAKPRIIQDSTKSLSGTIKRAKEVIRRMGHPDQTEILLKELSDFDYRLPRLGEQATTSIEAIEELLGMFPVIQPTERVMLRAAGRAVERRAPFHKDRNNINDAILMETYIEAMEAKALRGCRYGFVTHNTEDFSLPAGNKKLPHPDFARNFSKEGPTVFTVVCCSMISDSHTRYGGVR